MEFSGLAVCSGISNNERLKPSSTFSYHGALSLQFTPNCKLPTLSWINKDGPYCDPARAQGLELLVILKKGTRATGYFIGGNWSYLLFYRRDLKLLIILKKVLGLLVILEKDSSFWLF